MGKRSEVPLAERCDAVLSFLRREEPGSGHCPSVRCCRGNSVPLEG